MPIGIIEVLEAVDVHDSQRESAALAAELREAFGQLVVEGPAIGQQGKGIGAGLRQQRLHALGLLAELLLGGSELLLQMLVRFNQLYHHLQKSGRIGALGRSRASALISWIWLLCRADIGSHLRGQVVQADHEIASRLCRRLLQPNRSRHGSRAGVGAGPGGLAAAMGIPQPRRGSRARRPEATTQTTSMTVDAIIVALAGTVRHAWFPAPSLRVKRLGRPQTEGRSKHFQF